MTPLERVREAIKDRRPFANTDGTLYGQPYPVATTGELPEEWAAAYVHAAINGEIAYCVVSGTTPIAWILGSDVVVPPVAWSRERTACHQATVRAWLRGARPTASFGR